MERSNTIDEGKGPTPTDKHQFKKVPPKIEDIKVLQNYWVDTKSCTTERKISTTRDNVNVLMCTSQMALASVRVCKKYRKFRCPEKKEVITKRLMKERLRQD